jgi:hypothetical protein
VTAIVRVAGRGCVRGAAWLRRRSNPPIDRVITGDYSTPVKGLGPIAGGDNAVLP